MAVATANVRTTAFGDLKVTYGDWTADGADANFDLGLSGGRVYLAEFRDADSGNPHEVRVVSHSDSISGSVTTITLTNGGPVTTGRFLVVHK